MFLQAHIHVHVIEIIKLCMTLKKRTFDKRITSNPYLDQKSCFIGIYKNMVINENRLIKTQKTSNYELKNSNHFAILCNHPLNEGSKISITFLTNIPKMT